jgi:hypothetical protein
MLVKEGVVLTRINFLTVNILSGIPLNLNADAVECFFKRSDP